MEPMWVISGMTHREQLTLHPLAWRHGTLFVRTITAGCVCVSVCVCEEVRDSIFVYMCVYVGSSCVCVFVGGAHVPRCTLTM